ncbi:MAG: nicotinate-nucleotide--dimethylbenzimidazole phosphoribosyltransferase [Armatimonadetes bacterium]|nr:nicotinate-nucleotide--dimethylbenzimidazole phosphoribosyltransferase [Armatimonadota bacterium]
MSRLEETIARIAPLDEKAMADARRRQDDLTKPQGSLGRLEELSARVAGIQRNPRPRIVNKAIITMAGDHGVACDGVSAFPADVTPQMVYNFLRGGAGINVLARHVGARVVVVDMGVAVDLEPHPGLVIRKVAKGTANISRGPAMSREQAIQAIEAGIEVIEAEISKGLDIVGTGDMGIGNTTPSSAIVASVTGEQVSMVTGRGTGLDDVQMKNKIKLIDKALAVNRPDPHDGLDVLAKVGGFEIGGLAGVVLGAAANRIPVVVDGFISGAAALVAFLLCPTAREYMIAAHRSVEIGHQAAMRKMGIVPLMDLNMRLGEGTGAALGISIVEASVKILNEMATFSDAGVSEAQGKEAHSIGGARV